MTEKILAKHSDNSSVLPGDNIWTRVDKLMTHDVCGPGTFGIFQKEFGANAQVTDSSLPASVPSLPTRWSMGSVGWVVLYTRWGVGGHRDGWGFICDGWMGGGGVVMMGGASYLMGGVGGSS